MTEHDEKPEIDESDDTLTLDDLAPKKHFVRLPNYGRKVEMINPKSLSFRQRGELMSKSKRMVQLAEKSSNDTENEELLDELAESLRDLVKMILPSIKKSELEALEPFHLDQVSGAFLGRYGDMMRVVGKAIGPEAEKAAGSLTT